MSCSSHHPDRTWRPLCSSPEAFVDRTPTTKTSIASRQHGPDPSLAHGGPVLSHAVVHVRRCVARAYLSVSFHLSSSYIRPMDLPPFSIDDAAGQGALAGSGAVVADSGAAGVPAPNLTDSSYNAASAAYGIQTAPSTAGYGSRFELLLHTDSTCDAHPFGFPSTLGDPACSSGTRHPSSRGKTRTLSCPTAASQSITTTTTIVSPVPDLFPESSSAAPVLLRTYSSTPFPSSIHTPRCLRLGSLPIPVR